MPTENEKKMPVNRFWRIAGFLILAGLLLRVGVTLTGFSYGTDDEATFGLMALHLLEGKELPLIGWGAHYGGALQCYLAAPILALTGPSFIGLKLSVLPFSIGFLILLAVYVRRIAGETSALAALALTILPAPYLLSYAVNGFGIYAQIPFFAVLLLILTDRLCVDELTDRERKRTAFFWGLTAGIGTWTLPLFLIFIAAGLWQVFLTGKRRLFLTRPIVMTGLVGGIVGLLPLIYYNVMISTGGTFLRLGARMAGTTRAEVAHGGFLSTLVDSLLRRVENLPDLLLLQFKNLPPLFGLDSLPLLPAVLTGFVLLALCLTGLLIARREGKESTVRLSAVISIIPITILFSLVTALDRPRTLIGIYLSVVILAGTGAGRLWQSGQRGIRLAAASSLVLILAVSLWMDLPAFKNPDYYRMNMAVADFLKEQKIDRAYAEIGFALPVMFLTNEEILISTALSRVPIERHPTADAEVAASDRTAVVLHSSNKEWNEKFLGRLSEAGLSYQEKEIAPFIVLYDFNPPLKPALLPAEKEHRREDVSNGQDRAE